MSNYLAAYGSTMYPASTCGRYKYKPKVTLLTLQAPLPAHCKIAAPKPPAQSVRHPAAGNWSRQPCCGLPDEHDSTQTRTSTHHRYQNRPTFIHPFLPPNHPRHPANPLRHQSQCRSFSPCPFNPPKPTGPRSSPRLKPGAHGAIVFLRPPWQLDSRPPKGS